ncbi:MAG: c-type cytochrome [Opitutales bacterium]|nr:c-type cytochrome [Opitutales bacterium]
MRQFLIIYAFLVILVLVVFGFRGCKSSNPPLRIFSDMDEQARFHPQGKTSFFSDGRMDRPPVPGTVPFVTEMQGTYDHLSPDNRLRESGYLATGRLEDGSYGDGMPIQVNYDAMLRGQKLYDIYCGICHGRTGNGEGVVANERYGFATIISLLQTRIMDQPDGEIFDVITNGRNTMGAYGSKIRVEDRWKVVLYLRALQRANAASVEDVPAEKRGELGI